MLDRDPFACVLSGSHSLPCCAAPALGGPGVGKLKTGLAYIVSLPKQSDLRDGENVTLESLSAGELRRCGSEDL